MSIISLIQKNDLIPPCSTSILGWCSASQVRCRLPIGPKHGQETELMKAFNTDPRPACAGVLDAIAEALGRSSMPSPRRGWLTRLGSRFWNRQLRGVDAYITRADSLSAALDRWLWKQRARETEAWLAEAKDIFELEARLRELERRPPSRIWCRGEKRDIHALAPACFQRRCVVDLLTVIPL